MKIPHVMAHWIPSCMDETDLWKQLLHILSQMNKTDMIIALPTPLILQSLTLLIDFRCSETLMYKLSVQFTSVAQSCPILCDPMNHSTPGLPVHHQLLEFTQTHIHWVSDAIQQINATDALQFLCQHAIMGCMPSTLNFLRLEEMCSHLNVTGLEVIKRGLNGSYYYA